MPAYNVERYLGQAIDCVLAQTVGDFELLIVDDASTDGTARIAERAAADDARIRLLRHEENQWVSAARNTGIDAARGQYLWLCDPDDTFEPELLERCLDAIADAAPDVVVFGHVERYFDAKGAHLYDHAIVPPRGAYRSAEELRPHVLDLEVCTSLGYPWNKVYRLDTLRKSGVRFKRGDVVEDFAFNCELFQGIASLMVLDEPLYCYAKRQSANITNEFDQRYFAKHYARIKALRDQQEEWGLLNDEVRATLGSLFGRYILSAIERNGDKRSGMSRRQQEEWVRELFDDPLFNELIPFAEPHDDTALEVCLIPLKDKRVKGSVRLGKLIHLVRGRSTTIYSKLKSGR